MVICFVVGSLGAETVRDACVLSHPFEKGEENEQMSKFYSNSYQDHEVEIAVAFLSNTWFYKQYSISVMEPVEPEQNRGLH